MVRKFAFITGTAFALAGATAAGAATSYDLAGQFNPANTSNGPWTYGYEDTLGGTFVQYPEQVSVAGFAGRADTSVPGYSTYSVPADFINTSGSTVSSSSITLAAGQAAFHPGAGDQISIYRFTAPTAGVYQLDATFAGADTSFGATTVLINENNSATALESYNISGFNVPVSTGLLDLTLAAGETVDLGVEQNNHFYNDTTAVEATFLAVPEPATWALMLVGFGALGLAMRARRGLFATA